MDEQRSASEREQNAPQQEQGQVSRTPERASRPGSNGPGAAATQCQDAAPPPDPPRRRHDEEYPPELARPEAQGIHLRRLAADPSRSQGTAEDRLPPDTVGLALSGGGIRSATFCLGVLQALARQGWLTRVDLLSTVSGGGYIGSFLGRLFTRTWVTKAKSGPVAAVRATLTDTHSEPLRWLRDNGRYLSPNGAGDTWMAVAVMLRNLVALHVVLGTLVLTIFIFANSVRAVVEHYFDVPWLEKVFAVRAGSLIWWSPWLLLPAVTLLLLMIPVGWAYWLDQVGTTGRMTYLPPIAAGVAVAVCVLVCTALDTAAALALPATVATLGGLALGWWFFFRVRAWIKDLGDASKRRFRANSSSRLLAATTMMTLGLLGFGLVDSLGQTLYATAAYAGFKRTLLEPTTLPPLAALAGLLAAVRSLAPLLERFTGGGRWKLRWDLVVSALAAVVVVALLTLAAAVGHGIAWGFMAPAGNPGAVLTTSRAEQPTVTVTVEGTVREVEGSSSLQPHDITPASARTLRATARADAQASPAAPSAGRTSARKPASAMSLAWCGLGLLICAVLSFIFGRTIYFLTLSSHLTLYAARLARAYLGASNPERWKPSGMIVSDVVECDGVSWDDYRPERAGGPLHLVNLTLNETVSGTSRIEHRDRKGLPMAVGPCGLSVGSRYHGLWAKHKDSGEMLSGKVTPIATSPTEFHALADRSGLTHPAQARCLEQWVAASGAAFTTGLGWRTSLGASLLLGLGNVRLGHWWDSHIRPWQHAGTPRVTAGMWFGRLWTTAFPVQSYLLDELLARFHGPGRQYWYLSDGGHFENTGCYELIRRRVPLIICCDCGADPDYQFDDLANLTRRVRTDFGAELALLTSAPAGSDRWPVNWSEVGDYRTIRGGPKKESPPGGLPRFAGKAHAVAAVVTYPEDASLQTVIVFLKPSLTGAEPVDLLNYAATHPSFPQEPTTDQFFDEAQWESYRKLGEHIGDRIFNLTSTSES